MSVNVNITTGPYYVPGGEFRMDRLNVRIAVVDSRYTPGNRFLLVRGVDDLTPLNINMNNPWDSSLYVMAQHFNYIIYNDKNDWRPSDNIDIFYMNPSTSGFVAEFDSCGALFTPHRIVVISNIDNISLANLALYALPYASALFYGYVHNSFYNKIYLATDFLLMLVRHFNNGNLFCGLRGLLSGYYTRPNASTINTLISNNINVATKKSLLNPRTLGNKFIHHIIVNTWIRNRIADIMSSYIGRENNPGLWDEARSELEAFGNFLNSLQCGTLHFRVILDETNNTIGSNKLHAEIQYMYATDDKFEDIQRIEVDIRINP